MNAHPATVEIGVVVKPHGVRGQVALRLHHPASLAVDRGEGLSLRLPSGEVYTEGFAFVGRAGPNLLLAVDGVEDRDAAARLCGARLHVRREALAVAEGEYLYADLIGCTVRQRGAVLGEVAQVFSAGASDVLVVQQGAQECLVPFVPQWVVDVDMARRTIDLDDAGPWEMSPVAQRNKGR